MASRKTLLCLGGSPYQLAPIRVARARGHRVITCDYLPDNPGHCLADEYYNISTTDINGVLALARKLRIDGVLAFASDPAAPTAAIVAAELGLPGNPPEAVYTLTNKDKYKSFLRDNGFASPQSFGVTNYADAQIAYSLLAGDMELNPRVLVKPVDASGSRGVTLVQRVSDLPIAFASALAHSRARRVVIEGLIEHVLQIAGDGFIHQGEVVFCEFGREHFGRMPFVPIGESFPIDTNEALLTRVREDIQRLLTLLGMRTGAFNLDVLIAADSTIHLLEVGPRAGGNLISEALWRAFGVNLAELAVAAALGEPLPAFTSHKPRCVATWLPHTLAKGYFRALEIDPALSSYVAQANLFVHIGDRVFPFDASNRALGCYLLEFPDATTMAATMAKLEDLHRVVIDEQ